jgi:phage baseplate assembly protein W
MATQVYARDVSFPMRFDEDCDLFMDEDELLIDQSLQIIAFLPNGTVILFRDMGSGVEASVFDPSDRLTELVIDTSLRTAIESLEKRVTLDRDFVFDSTPDELKVVVAVPFRVAATGKLFTSRIVIAKPVGQ